MNTQRQHAWLKHLNHGFDVCGDLTVSRNDFEEDEMMAWDLSDETMQKIADRIRENLGLTDEEEPDVKYEDFVVERRNVGWEFGLQTYDELSEEEYEQYENDRQKFYDSLQVEPLYSDEQINDAINTIRDHIFEVLKGLGKQANLISYLISPNRTAVGASFDYNSDVIERAFYNNVVCQEDLAYDGNAGYTLLALAKMIKEDKI